MSRFLQIADDGCRGLLPIVRVVRKGLFPLVQIVIPIILIVYGMLDMGKAVTAGKDEEIIKSALTFGRLAIAAILVFFVPSIVGWILALNSVNIILGGIGFLLAGFVMGERPGYGRKETAIGLAIAILIYLNIALNVM